MQPRYGADPKPNMSICPNCHSIKEPYQSICSKCLTRACPSGHRMNEGARICPLCGWEDKLWRPPRPRVTGKTPTGHALFEDSFAEYYRCPQCKQKFLLEAKPVDPNSIKCRNPHCGALFDGKPNRISKEEFLARSPHLETIPRQSESAAPKETFKTGATVKSVPRTHSESHTDMRYRPTVGVETSKHLEHFRKPMKTSGVEMPDFSKILKPVLYVIGALAICAVLFFGISAIIDSGVFTNIETPKPAATMSSLNIDSVSHSSVTDFGARITWRTDKPSTSQIEYGTTAGLGNVTSEDNQLVTDHAVNLNNLKPETTYFYRVKSAAGKTVSVSPIVSKFITAAAPDNKAPVISDVKITNISDIDAVISWKTDEKTTGLVRFGTNTSYGQDINAGKEFTLEHSVIIRNLSPSTSYHFSIRSLDASSNEALSADTSFLTLEPVKVGKEVGNRAPDFTLPAFNGKSVTLSALRGRPVILNFWRIACPACVYELPFFEEVYKSINSSQRADKPQIYTVDLMDYEEHVNNLVNDNHFTFPILMDFKGEVMSGYGLNSIPMTFFIDANGIIQKVQLGRFENTAELSEIINSL